MGGRAHLRERSWHRPRGGPRRLTRGARACFPKARGLRSATRWRSPGSRSPCVSRRRSRPRTSDVLAGAGRARSTASWRFEPGPSGRACPRFPRVPRRPGPRSGGRGCRARPGPPVLGRHFKTNLGRGLRGLRGGGLLAATSSRISSRVQRRDSGDSGRAAAPRFHRTLAAKAAKIAGHDVARRLLCGWRCVS